MAFEKEYFDKNKKRIIKDYYSFCEKQILPNPMYCVARPTNPNFHFEEGKESNRYIKLYISMQKPGEKFIWISAITEQGFLLFIKIKTELSEIETEGEKPEEKLFQCKILGQFSYYVNDGKIKELYY